MPVQVVLSIYLLTIELRFDFSTCSGTVSRLSQTSSVVTKLVVSINWEEAVTTSTLAQKNSDFTACCAING